MSNITIKIEEGKYKYYYTTEETVLKCYICKKEFRSAKYCNKCSKEQNKPIATIKHTKIRTGFITKNLEDYSCSCIFSSWYRFGKFWTDKHPKSRCKHIKFAISEIKWMNKNGTK